MPPPLPSPDYMRIRAKVVKIRLWLTALRLPAGARAENLSAVVSLIRPAARRPRRRHSRTRDGVSEDPVIFGTAMCRLAFMSRTTNLPRQVTGLVQFFR